MATSIPVLATAVAGLEPVLGGDVPPQALVFIVGPPGAGKTVLASQLLFHAARNDTPVLILTAFSEGHVKLIEHVRQFAFFDEGVIGNRLSLLSLPGLLGQEADATAVLVRTIRDTGARVVLLDGFQGVNDLVEDNSAIRRLLASLSSQLSFLDVTVLVTLEGHGRAPELMSQLTTGDVVLGLDYRVDSLRHTRHLEVIKQRGKASLPGLHTYTISDQGITVFPRLEARPLREPRPFPVEREGFGLPELDLLLNGGLMAGTTTVLAGAPGSGKTTLGLHWALTSAESGSSTVFLSFGERETQVRAKGAAFGLEVGTRLTTDAFTFIRIPMIEIDPDVVADRILVALTDTTRRVIIDDIAALVRALGTRAADYLAALTDQLHAAGVTSLLLFETEAFSGLRFDLANTPLSVVADNVVIVQQVAVAGQLHRVVAVLKMRYSDHDRTLRELILDRHGVRILSRAETAPGVLQEAAEVSGGFAAPDEQIDEPETPSSSG